MRPEPQQRIDKKALQVWRIVGGINSLLIWLIPIVYIILVFQLEWIRSLIWVLAIGATILTVLLVGIIPKLRWRRWRYEVSEHEVDLQRGVLVIRRSLIPMVRVQHVDTRQGPLLRYYGLSSVTISTAAGMHEIPALSNEVADHLRDRISELARVADDDV